MTDKSTESTDSSIAIFLDVFVNKMLTVGLILVVFGLPSSLMRWLDTGFMPIYAIHIFLSTSAILINVFKGFISLNMKGSIMILNLMIVGLVSVLTFGLSGIGTLVGAVCGYLSNLLWGEKIAIKISAIYILLLCFLAFCYINNIFTPSIDLNVYASSINSWLINVVVFIIVTLMLIGPTSEFIKQHEKLILEISNKNSEIEHLANHDKLTGLPSLRLADDRLEYAISIADRNNSNSALLYLDLDGFKSINDTFGHDAGDMILQTVSHRFQNAIRSTDTCCRIGGDEFLLIITDIKDTTSIERMCVELNKLACEPVDYGDKKLSVAVSIGVAIYPDNADDAKSLRNCADKAMYDVKKTGKSNYKFYCSAKT